jgi:hypothetical protein
MSDVQSPTMRGQLGFNPVDTQEKLIARASPTYWDLVKPIAAATLRHVATAGGALLVAKGVTSDSGAAQFVGAVMTLGGIAWSWVQKYGATYAKQALQDASTLLHAHADAARKSAPLPPGGGGAPVSGDPRQRSTG